ncbi:MAG: BNR-4 repeat-containing protein [Nitrospinota bacterium]
MSWFMRLDRKRIQIQIGGLAIAALLLPTTVFGYKFTTLATVKVRWDQNGQHFSPITSDDNGTLYFAFINSSNKIVVGKKVSGSNAVTTTITPLRANVDQYHSVPSIAIDLKGFIHVFGPMHNTAMDYLVSKKTYDVASGFDRPNAASQGFHLGIKLNATNKESITYPKVFYDDDYNPWVAYRLRVGSSGWGPGSQAAGLARYNTAAGSWEAIGGNTNPLFSPPGGVSADTKCFLWSFFVADPNATNGWQGYQAHAAKPYFDNGRLHYAFKHNRDSGDTGWAQDLLYFYSDDGGKTWKTADGVSVAGSPVSIKNTPSAVMTVNVPNGVSNTGDGFSATSKGRPVVGYYHYYKGQPHSVRFAVFEKGDWKITVTSLYAMPGRLLIDSNNVWYMVAGADIYSSTTDGVSWKRYSSGLSADGFNANVDLRYFKKTNKIRYTAHPQNKSGTTAVKIIEFVSDEWAPSSDTPPVTDKLAPAAPTNLISR